MDDWAYRRVAASFAATGHLQYFGWVSMSFVGQVLWAWPWLKVFGDHGWVLSVSTIPLAAAAVVSAWWLARRLLPAAAAAGAVLLLLAAPGMALNTTTFMTDVPALGAELACVALGAAGLARRGAPRAWLVGASVLVGLLGYSIREFDLAAPVAVLVCAALAERGWRRAVAVAAGAALLAVCAGLYEWSLSVPGLWKLTPVAPTLGSVERTLQAYFSVALFVSPAVALAAWRRAALLTSRPERPGRPGRFGRVSRRRPLAAAAALAAGVALGAGPGLFVGNDVQPTGVGSTLLVGGGRAVLVGPWFWHVLAVLAVVSGAALAWLLAGLPFGSPRRWRRWDWASPLALLGVFAFFAAAGFAVYSLTAVKIFDRYLWPVELCAAILLLRAARRVRPEARGAGGPPPAPPLAPDPHSDSRRRRSRGLHAPGRPWHVGAGWVAAPAVVLVGAAALVTTVNSDVYGAALWRAGRTAVAAGVPPAKVDAGLEWVGAHTTAPLAPAPADLPPYEPWYPAMEPGFEECAVVSARPLDYRGLLPIGVESYDTLGVAAPAKLWIYRVDRAGC
jgi:4-amino-4-deoxy-L-arabinose transferase-like glycosyltransferase